MSEIITVTGNVVTDPEQRVVSGDDKVTSFRLAATERRFDDQTGTWVDGHTSYYSVAAFKVLGLNAFAALRRGQRVIVTGRLRVKEWDNGTKQGINADITAEGIGHDMLFGVTTLQRSGKQAAAVQTSIESESSSAESAAEVPSAPALVGADGWAIPQGTEVDARPVPF